MLRCFYYLLVISLASFYCCLAQAHFLFLRITPHAEAGPAVEVYFSELAEAGDPRFIKKIAHTKLWIQSSAGKFSPLPVHQGVDRLRAALPTAENVSVAGELVYGVLEREVPFLLKHFPKTIAGDPEQLNRLQSNGRLPLEIMPKLAADKISLVVLHQGKPIPRAKFTVVDRDLSEQQLQADESGQVSWIPPASGQYCVYTRLDEKVAGKLQGKKYAEIRQFATLSLRWPLVRSGADPQAVAMFQEAIKRRATWKHFSGFTADISGTVDGRAFEGEVKIAAAGKVELELDDEVVSPWVQGKLRSIVQHRLPSSSSTRQPPVLRFADDDEHHRLGRLLTFVGGRFASSYRVKDRQLMVVNRNFGKENFTLTVLKNKKTEDGFFLPLAYTVQYWDTSSGSLLRSETVQNHWQRIGSWDLPAGQLSTTASSAGLAVRGFTLSDHQLLNADP